MKYSAMLEGMTLEGGWNVVEKLTKKSSTGGCFSIGYRVRNIENGMEGYLKALDISEAFETNDLDSISIEIEKLTRAYNFEKNICDKCRGYSMRRVIHAIASGTVRTNPADMRSIVNYLIFELADGDIRGHIEFGADFDHAFALRSLQHVATALKSLHSRDIAHQDIKPSNILIFKLSRESKVADLGNAWSKDLAGPHDKKDIPGDATYAPPEFLYRNVPAEENRRRFGSDLYHLGGLAVFFFTGSHINTLLNKHLASQHRYHRWAGSYAEVLPYLLEAFAKSLQEFDAQVPQYLSPKLRRLVEQLCDPDPCKRGDPLCRHEGGNQHSLERYISVFNNLAFLAATKLNSRK